MRDVLDHQDRDGLVAVALLAAAELMFAAALYGAALVLRAEQASFGPTAGLLVRTGGATLAITIGLSLLAAWLAGAWGTAAAALAAGFSLAHLGVLVRSGATASTGHAAGLWWIGGVTLALHLVVVGVVRVTVPTLRRDGARLASLVGAIGGGLLLLAGWLMSGR